MAARSDEADPAEEESLMAKIPDLPDNSPEAQAFRLAAIDSCDCPKCGATKGFGCKAKNGGSYNPRYMVHRPRLAIHAESA